MTHRQRFMGTLTFQPVDRIPLVDWGIREATMRAFLAQGYPEGTPTREYFGLDPMVAAVPVDMGMHPMFEQQVLWSNAEYKIWRDELGATRKDFLMNATPGFVTRSWLEFPVKNMADFEAMKPRFDAAHPGRIPPDFAARAKALDEGDVAAHLSIPFLFWVGRDMVGFENLCTAFYDDPALVDAMFEHLTQFVIDLLERFIRDIRIDIVEFKEDMAYKGAPMISPAMFDRFMRPHYRRVIDYLKSRGVNYVYVDCDGYPGGLIPRWLDVGVDAISPNEIAAGNDLFALRREYPTLGLMGGIDKRELAKSRAHVYREVVDKVPALIEKGGYIPHVDHAVPPDISLANYVYFRQLLACVAGGETPPAP